MDEDLVPWLGEQLDEDEQIAKAAHTPNWSTDGRRGIHYGVEDGWMTDALTTADADHIARHDPARVLREIEAKREIRRWHSSPHTLVDGFCVEEGGPCTHRGEAECTVCGESGCTTLRLLALPYADRPGYREEWRP